MSRNVVIAMALAACIAAGCESQPTKEDIGMATGAVLGGVLGHQIGKGTGQTVATIGGAALGGFLGGRVGRDMDRTDRQNATNALERSADGEVATWRNQGTGQRYSVTPTRTYRDESGGICRDFTSVAQIGDRNEFIRGTACRQPDGTWKTP